MKLPTPSLRLAGVIAAAMALAAAGALALTPAPAHDRTAAPVLADTLPANFGPWRLEARQDQQAAVSDGTETGGELYDQVVMRSYVNRDTGQAVMLALAWGAQQRQDVKVHRPEVCYPAQGFSMLRAPEDGVLALPQHAQPIPVRTLLTRQGSQIETVRYWIRIGNRYGGDGFGTRVYLLREGLEGRVPDGILVRASQRLPARGDVNAEAGQSYAVLDQFLRDLTAAVPAATRDMLVR
jgi:EpsI family protein